MKSNVKTELMEVTGELLWVGDHTTPEVRPCRVRCNHCGQVHELNYYGWSGLGCGDHEMLHPNGLQLPEGADGPDDEDDLPAEVLVEALGEALERADEDRRFLGLLSARLFVLQGAPARLEKLMAAVLAMKSETDMDTFDCFWGWYHEDGSQRYDELREEFDRDYAEASRWVASLLKAVGATAGEEVPDAE